MLKSIIFKHNELYSKRKYQSLDIKIQIFYGINIKLIDLYLKILYSKNKKQKIISIYIYYFKYQYHKN